MLRPLFSDAGDRERGRRAVSFGLSPPDCGDVRRRSRRLRRAARWCTSNPAGSKCVAELHDHRAGEPTRLHDVADGVQRRGILNLSGLLPRPDPCDSALCVGRTHAFKVKPSPTAPSAQLCADYSAQETHADAQHGFRVQAAVPVQVCSCRNSTMATSSVRAGVWILTVDVEIC